MPAKPWRSTVPREGAGLPSAASDDATRGVGSAWIPCPYLDPADPDPAHPDPE